MKIKAIIASLLLCLAANGADLEGFLRALAAVESSNNERAVGDKVNGKDLATGIFQIHREYWQDAVNFDKTIGGRYEDCFKKDYSRKIVLAYFKRYEKVALANGDWESLARLHNAGCGWRKNKAKTDGYWKKVKAQL